MKTISEIKKDLEFNRGLSSLIEALKNIAVSQYRSMERKIKTFGNFLSSIESFFELVNPESCAHPFVIPKSKTQMVVAITSDSGLLGGLNMEVVGTALRQLQEIPGRLIVIGERGKAYAQESGVPFTAFGGIKDEERYGQAVQLRNYLTEKFLSESFGYLKIVYPHPVSFTVQRVQIVSVLPFIAKIANENKKVTAADTLFESSPADIVEYLVYLWLGQKAYELFGLSRLAEFAARYVHLEESLHKLKEMDTKLKLQYFRVRHEIIDRNMRELFSARLLYANQ
ncbi:MAG: F0F1 ATP synthase subunit gamma [Candidatus Omnitrophica bacterium]|nr:F0F1 ATP synthase subunit gamma [Candidatus Omnitrophota bacterium]